MKYDIDSLRQTVIDKKRNRSIIVDDILNAETFREAAIISKMFLPSQSYGEILVKWLSKHYNFTKLNASEKKGDQRVFEKYNTEIKSSLCDDGKHCNYVQLRLTHEISFYLLPTYDFVGDEVYYFLLNKEEMIEMVKKYGGYAHGTKGEKGLIEDNIFNPDIEFAIRPTIGKDCWNDLLKYRITEEDILNESYWDNRTNSPKEYKGVNGVVQQGLCSFYAGAN